MTMMKMTKVMKMMIEEMTRRRRRRITMMWS